MLLIDKIDTGWVVCGLLLTLLTKKSEKLKSRPRFGIFVLLLRFLKIWLV